MKKATLALFAALLAALTLTGCNTVHGLGQDVQAGGRARARAPPRPPPARAASRACWRSTQGKGPFLFFVSALHSIA